MPSRTRSWCGRPERSAWSAARAARSRGGRDATVLGVGVGGGVLLEQDDVLAHPDGAHPALLGLGGRSRPAARGWPSGLAVGTHRSMRTVGSFGTAGGAVGRRAGGTGHDGGRPGATSGQGRSRSATPGQVQEELLLVVAADHLEARRAGRRPRPAGMDTAGLPVRLAGMVSAPLLPMARSNP